MGRNYFVAALALGSCAMVYLTKPDNAAALLHQPDVDGALVGGASLTAESFLAIVRAAF